MSRRVLNQFVMCALVIIASAFFQGRVLAQAPTASTVPFVASSPTTPHTSWIGNPVTLKGTMSSPLLGTDTFTWDWDPGDGGAHCTGTIDTHYTPSGPNDNPFVLACPHAYLGAGPVYVAVLNVTDTSNNSVAPPANCPPSITKGACYYTSINPPPPNLPVEVNNAIDNGLWYLHTYMNRTKSGFGASIGNWTGGAASGTHADTNGAGDTGPNALDCTAFEVAGFLTSNSPANPYSADVALCLAGVFDQLTTIGIGSVNIQPFGTFNPDKNSNGIGVEHNGGDVNYQTGMMLDSIVAAGTPTLPVPAGTTLANNAAGKGSGTGGTYLFKDAVQDMVDDYSYCQNTTDLSGFGVSGGWHYTCQEQNGDNSVSQWAAIGIIPARRILGATVDPFVGSADAQWLDSSFSRQNATNGYFGYTSNSPIWGPYADTPSGLVQLAMNGLGRGTTSPGGNNLWDSAETFLRDNFGNARTGDSSGATGSMKDYYYGMFSFTKAMLLHDNSGTGLGNTQITDLQSLDDPHTCASPGVPVTGPGSGAGPCYPPLDWYASQSAAHGGTSPTDGVARTIVGDQLGDGSWFGQNYVTNQSYFQTAVSVIMLNKTVFQALPVACFTSNPSHIASGGPVTLNGSCSVEQNPANTLVSWQWDISGTGAGYTIGPGNSKCLTPSCSQMIANFTLPAGQSLPYNFPVKLLVTDSGSLTATVTGNIVISVPPNPPNANAGGPYSFCPNTSASGALIYSPFLLDGSHSTNPDQGTTDGTSGAPPSTITAYDWDYACAGSFNSAHVVQPNATTAFNVPADFGTSFNVCLRVTNNDNLAYPTAGLAAGLSSVASAGVTIHQATDQACTHCVMTLQATATSTGTVQLSWTDTNTSPPFLIDHYNIYRSLSASFVPFTQIAGANSSPFVPAVKVSNPAGGTLIFTDTNVVSGTTYYYRIAPATVNDTETCQGNVTFALLKQATTLSYSGPTVMINGGSAILSGVLDTIAATPIQSRSVVFTLGTGATAQTCTGVTDATGKAVCTIAVVNQPVGQDTVADSFAGDATYLPSSNSAKVTLATNVSTCVNVFQTGSVLNFATNKWTATLTAVNNCSTPITGPIAVVLTNLSSNATMLNPSGTYLGNPYFTVAGAPFTTGATLTLTGGTLAPGALANATMQYSDSNNLHITFTAVTYSGGI